MNPALRKLIRIIARAAVRQKLQRQGDKRQTPVK
jgi:hypothetical protein